MDAIAIYMEPVRYLTGDCGEADERFESLLENLRGAPSTNKDGDPTGDAKAFEDLMAGASLEGRGCRGLRCTQQVTKYVQAQVIRSCGDVARVPGWWTARRGCHFPLKALTIAPYTMHATKSMQLTAWDIIKKHVAFCPGKSANSTALRKGEATEMLLGRVKAKKAAGELRRDVSPFFVVFFGVCVGVR